MTPHSSFRFKSQMAAILLLAVSLCRLSMAAVPVAVTFTGSSTLHGFVGTVATSAVATATLEDGSEQVVVAVPVKEIKTGHNGRDERMYKMFDVKNHPEIIGTAAWSALRDGAATNLSIRITICGETRDVAASRIPVDAAQSGGPFMLGWDVSLKDFNLKAPSVIGLIRVSDTVHVSVIVDPGALAAASRSAEKDMR